MIISLMPDNLSSKTHVLADSLFLLLSVYIKMLDIRNSLTHLFYMSALGQIFYNVEGELIIH